MDHRSRSEDIRKFMKENKINHRKITPLWPQGNAEAENFMKPLKKCIQAASVENKNWKKELYTFLLNYRTTPHCTTKIAPATALFGRTIRNKLPAIPSTVLDMVRVNQEIDTADRTAKEKRKVYTDKRRAAKKPHFAIGDQVLVKQKKVNKLTPRFDPQAYKITKIKGTMITANRPNHTITRNCSHFKLFIGSSNFADKRDDDDDGLSEHAGITTPDGDNREKEVDRYPTRNRDRPSYYHEQVMP